MTALRPHSFLTSEKPGEQLKQLMKQEMELILSIAADTGCAPKNGARVLDFGCGAGELVRCFLDQGFDAYGADIDAFWLHGDTRNPQPQWQGKNLKRFGKIEERPYRLPFEDNTFDFCCSTVVLEHVGDYREAFAEIHRVLKPGGGTLHLFPARWRPIESHVFVPFSSVFQSPWYLAFWARLGIRNQFQRGLPWREAARLNAEYLRDHTNYLSAKAIRQIALDAFGNIAFPHHSYVRNHPGMIGKLGRLAPVPGYSVLATTFGTRVISMTKGTEQESEGDAEPAFAFAGGQREGSHR